MLFPDWFCRQRILLSTEHSARDVRQQNVFLSWPTIVLNADVEPKKVMKNGMAMWPPGAYLK
jgi:hypothetical protein